MIYLLDILLSTLDIHYAYYIQYCLLNSNSHLYYFVLFKVSLEMGRKLKEVTALSKVRYATEDTEKALNMLT